MGFFSSEGTRDSSTRSWPAAFTAPGIVEAVQNISSWMGRPRAFPEETYAQITPGELSAIEGLKAAGAAYPEMMAGYMDPALAGYQAAMRGPTDVFGMNLQNVMDNPALAGVADAIQSRVNRNLTENILPQISVNEVLGPSGGVARGIAGRGTSDVLAEQLANMYGNAWQAGLGAETTRLGQALQARQGALATTPAMVALGEQALTRPSGLLGQAGALERIEDQRRIDEDIARLQFNQNDQFNRYSAGLNALMGPAVAFGSEENKQKVSEEPSGFAQLGGAVGSLGGLAGGLFGQQGMFPNAFGGLFGPSATMGGGFVGPDISGGNPYGGGFGIYANPWTYGAYTGYGY